MTKEEEYKKTLIDMWDRVRTTNKGEPRCGGVICADCPLEAFDGCSDAQDIFDIYRTVNKWGEEHQCHKEYKVSKFEYDVLKYFSDNTKYIYIARDKDGDVHLFNKEPRKIDGLDGCWYRRGVYSIWVFNKLFQFVQWEDKKPTFIQDVLENCEVIGDDEKR